MLSIPQGHSRAEDGFGLGNGTGPYWDSQITHRSTSQSEQRELTIMTLDGDRVTLSGASQLRTSNLTYSSLAGGEGTAVSVRHQSHSLEMNSNLSMVVEGDLSQEELQDIENILNSIDEMMKTFLTGDPDQAQSVARGFGDLDSISGFTASLKVQKTTLFEQQRTIDTRQFAPGQMKGWERTNGNPIRAIVEAMIDRLETLALIHEKTKGPLDHYFEPLFKEGSGPQERQERVEAARDILSEIRLGLERQLADPIGRG